MQVRVATAADAIVAKLEWAAAGASERPLREVHGALGMRSGDLDSIEQGARELGPTELWERAKADAGLQEGAARPAR